MKTGLMFHDWTTVPDPSFFKHLKVAYPSTFLSTREAVWTFQEKNAHAPRIL